MVVDLVEGIVGTDRLVEVAGQTAAEVAGHTTAEVAEQIAAVTTVVAKCIASSPGMHLEPTKARVVTTTDSVEPIAFELAD